MLFFSIAPEETFTQNQDSRGETAHELYLHKFVRLIVEGREKWGNDVSSIAYN